MWKCEFYDIENLDGYFSGIMYIYVNGRRYIVEFGYDIEFKKLKLMNCNNIMYNSMRERYSNDELADLYTQNYSKLINEIQLQIGWISGAKTVPKTQANKNSSY